MNEGLELRTLPSLQVAGFVTRASNRDPSAIGRVWQLYFERSGELAADAGPHAVYHDYESDHTAPYSLLVGLPVAESADLPEGWQSVQVPEAAYLVFPVPEGPMPDVLISTWERIWEHFDRPGPYERTYTFDFERHGAPTEILISVRPAPGVG